MRLQSFIAPLALIAAVALPQAARAQRYELSGSNVALYNLAGSIRLEAGSGASVVVEVQRKGRDAERLTVRTDAIDGVPSLRIIYPGDEIVADELEDNTETTVRVHDDGTFNRSRDGRRVRIRSRKGDRDATHAEADLIVRVPAGVRVEAHLAVGELSAQDVNGELSLHTSAGGIGISGGRGALRAETASGEIGVQNTQGDLRLSTASGDIGVQNATAQSIEVNVASGSIHVQDAKADRIDLEAASGSVRVTRTTTPRLKANSASGDVRVDLNGDVRDVDLSTASGSVEAAVPAAFAGEVELETASGSVDVDFPINISMQRRNHLRGTIGTGGNARLSLSSASGNVKLLKR